MAIVCRCRIGPGDGVANFVPNGTPHSGSFHVRSRFDGHQRPAIGRRFCESDFGFVLGTVDWFQFGPVSHCSVPYGTKASFGSVDSSGRQKLLGPEETTWFAPGGFRL